MKNWNKAKENKVLMTLAVLSLAVSVGESMLYFADYGGLIFRVLLTLQNTIKVFTFKPDIGLKDARNFILAEPSVIRTMVGYAYMIALFVAPFCTIATVYRVFERAFRLVFWLKKENRKELMVVFGFNNTVRQLLKDKDGMKDRRVHIVSSDAVSVDEQYGILKKNIRLHIFNLFLADADDQQKMLGELELQRASHVFLLEDSSASNFALLQAISDASKIEFPSNIKIHCRCEDDGIYQIIEGFYEAGEGQRHKQYDLEVFNLQETQVREMFRKYPLHSCWYPNKNDETIRPKDWRVHLLILGFGRLGQQVLLQAMNLGVVHSENPICIDVVDCQGPEKWKVFLNRFAVNSLTHRTSENEYHICEDWADGSLTMRFHKYDVRYDSFRELLSQLMDERTGTFTYVVSAINSPDIGLHCASMIRRLLCTQNQRLGQSVPIMLRMDNNLRLREYMDMDNGNSRLQGVHLIPNANSILTYDYLLAETLDESAKRYNTFYHHMFEGGNSADLVDINKAWQKLPLSLRNDNRAAAQHLYVLSDILSAECGDERQKRLNSLFIGTNPIMPYNGETWGTPPKGNEFLERVKALEDPLALEMLKTEHRRWCYQRISTGWAQGRKAGEKKPKKDIQLCLNPCLVPWKDLEQVDINSCIYDLMPLMAEYESKLQNE